MKNKQTILYTLLGLMFGIVVGMIAINSASAIETKAAPQNQEKSCHKDGEKCNCGEKCEEGKECECKKCDHAKEPSCSETAQTCGL